MTEDQYLDALGEREGLTYAGPPRIDQPTAPYGVTAVALAADLGLPVAAVTVSMLQALTAAQAREVARRTVRRELTAKGFDRISYEPLRYAVLDYAYNSGDERAVRWLQRTALLAPALVTGILDARTLVALRRLPAVLVLNALCAERAHAALHGGAGGDQFAVGVMRRAISFVVPLDQALPAASTETTALSDPTGLTSYPVFPPNVITKNDQIVKQASAAEQQEK